MCFNLSTDPLTSADFASLMSQIPICSNRHLLFVFCKMSVTLSVAYRSLKACAYLNDRLSTNHVTGIPPPRDCAEMPSERSRSSCDWHRVPSRWLRWTTVGPVSLSLAQTSKPGSVQAAQIVHPGLGLPYP